MRCLFPERPPDRTPVNNNKTLTTITAVHLSTDHPVRPLRLRRFPVPLTMGLHDGKFLCDLSLAEEERVRSRLTLVVESNTSQVRWLVDQDSFFAALGTFTAQHRVCVLYCVAMHGHAQICSIQKAGGPAISKEELATALTLCGARLKLVAQALEGTQGARQAQEG